MSDAITEVLKLGLAGVVLVIAGGILFFCIKFFLPLARAIQPSNGKGSDTAGPVFLAIQQIATLPGEIKALNATIVEMLNHIWTKDEMMEELRKNRVEIAESITGSLAKLTVQVIEERRIRERRIKRRK